MVAEEGLASLARFHRQRRKWVKVMPNVHVLTCIICKCYT